MEIRLCQQLSALPVAAWNALTGTGHPFLRHEFLSALEIIGDISPATGWTPTHLLAYDGDRLAGAVPLYLKNHSFGEFVYDWAWANAWQQAGHRYYPKLIAAIPHSPVTCPRLLIHPDADTAATADLLIDETLALAKRLAVSSLHWLFPAAGEIDTLAQHGFMIRSGAQFHWRNHGYRHFDDYLARMSASHRKKVRRERRFVHEAGVRVEVLDGTQLTEADWRDFYRYHIDTLRKYGSEPFLSFEFFRLIGERLPQHVVMALARRDTETIGAAFSLRSADTLYGRFWGGQEDIHSLHFETCLYAPIEYCIAQGIQRFEPGQGGEHKVARGFEPVETRSAHWVRDAGFARAVEDFLRRERGGVADYIDTLAGHTPFRHET